MIDDQIYLSALYVTTAIFAFYLSEVISSIEKSDFLNTYKSVTMWLPLVITLVSAVIGVVLLWRYYV